MWYRPALFSCQFTLWGSGDASMNDIFFSIPFWNTDLISDGAAIDFRVDEEVVAWCREYPFISPGDLLHEEKRVRYG